MAEPQTVLACAVTGAGELDNCDHARLVLTRDDTKALLTHRGLVERAAAALKQRFLRVEAFDALCEFGAYEDAGGEPWEPPGDAWAAEPGGHTFKPCEHQDVAVIRLEEDGVTWRMVPRYGDESPLATLLTWAEVEAVSRGECPR
jgi:hypothetical protein